MASWPIHIVLYYYSFECDDPIQHDLIMNHQTTFDLTIIPNTSVGPFHLGQSFWKVVELLRADPLKYQSIQVKSWSKQVSPAEATRTGRSVKS